MAYTLMRNPTADEISAQREAAAGKLAANLLPRAGASWELQNGAVPTRYNNTCHVCVQPIQYPQDEQWYLLSDKSDFRPKGSKLPQSKLHVACYMAWKLEADELDAPNR